MPRAGLCRVVLRFSGFPEQSGQFDVTLRGIVRREPDEASRADTTGGFCTRNLCEAKCKGEIKRCHSTARQHTSTPRA
jgi:hypothetical protein